LKAILAQSAGLVDNLTAISESPTVGLNVVDIRLVDILKDHFKCQVQRWGDKAGGTAGHTLGQITGGSYFFTFISFIPFGKDCF
jgi:hypothetical protein